MRSTIRPILIALALAAFGLSGCAVSTSTPLFVAADAASRPMAQGRWAMTGPGCDVSPGGDAKLPECAIAMTIKDGTWTVDSSAAFPGPMRKSLPMMLNRFGLSDAYACLVVAGEPTILQCQTKAPDLSAQPPAAPTDSSQSLKTKVLYSYSALKPLQYDAKGRIVKAVLWLIPCPDALPAPGFHAKAENLNLPCVPDSPEAVRSQAVHMRPFQSVFLVWVGE